MMPLRKGPHPEAPGGARPRRTHDILPALRHFLRCLRAGSLRGGAAAMREALLLAGDEFEQGGAAVFGLAAGAQGRDADRPRALDAFAPPAEVSRYVGLIAAEVARSVPLVRQRHRM